MEVIAFAVFIGILLQWQERRMQARTHADTPCMYCPQWVRFDRQNVRWIHYDGRTHAEWPNIRYDLPGPRPPLHVAVPFTGPLS